MNAIDVLRGARARSDDQSLFDRISHAGGGKPDAVIAAVRILKSVRPKLPVAFYQIPSRTEGVSLTLLTPRERAERNDILERAIALAIHTKAA